MKMVISFFVFLQCTILSAQETGARYLIITHDNYYNALIPLAQWKTRKGLKTKIVRLSEIGSDSTQIRNYVINAYNNWTIKPKYLLLVGNNNQIPFPYCVYLGDQYYSDNYYTNVVGDFRNEIIPGRFWIYDTINAKTVVAKVLGYEKNPHLDDSLWFRKGATIVYDHPLDSDSLLYWEDARYAHNLMVNAGFVHIDSLAYSLGDDSMDVIDVINHGCSYILYRGLGFGTWDGPFMNIPVALMTNRFKLPIVISATCATVEGIGYYWLLSGTPEEPKGTVGFFGTTTALGGAAEFRSALARGTIESIFCDSFCTLGKAAEAGRLNYYSLFGNILEYNSWTCLGDPEMTVWTTFPRHLDVLHDSIAIVGLCTFSINVQANSVPAESALVCVMAKKDSTFYHYGRTDNLGNINFTDTLHIPADSVLITVTGRNLEPYYDAIPVYFKGGPYVILNKFSISDAAGGNGDSIANPGEDIELPVWVRNWGDSIADNVSGIMHSISTTSAFALHDTLKYFGNILPLDSAFTSANGYNVVIADNCPDKHGIKLQLVIHDTDGSSWTSYLDFVVHAPIITFDEYCFPGDLKYTCPGDTDQLIVELKNIGSYKTESVIGKIFSNDSLLTVIDSISTFGTISPGSIGNNQSNPFIITSDPKTPSCHPVNIKLVLTSGVYIDTFDFTIYVGQKDYLIWDADLNHSSGPVIKTKLDSLNFYGDYATLFPYKYLSLYKSLFVCAGVYSNNYIIKDTSQVARELEEYIIELDGRAYLEGGDVWFTDPHFYHGYNFLNLFHIYPVGSGIGSLPRVTGTINTFTQNMVFRYQGENLSLDHIDSLIGSSVIFRKTTINYQGCGVAANNRTIGLSFELGGLVDSILPSTKLVLIDSIMNYFGIEPLAIKETALFKTPTMANLNVFPNPFKKHLAIRFSTSIDNKASLEIYDVMGRCLKTFFNNQAFLDSGTQSLTWDGTDNFGRRVPQGVYFVHFETANYKRIEKVILLR